VREQFASLYLAWACVRKDIGEQEAARKAAHDARYQTNVQFKVGDRVLIRQAGRRSKMHMPHVGPFQIKEVLERDRYAVAGRRNAKRDHHEFHVSRLKLWPVGADDEEIYMDDSYYDVDSIVGHKIEKGQKGLLYRVRWVGYGAADDEWLKFADMNPSCMRHALEYIKDNGLLVGSRSAEAAEGADTVDGAAPAEVAAAPIVEDVAPEVRADDGAASRADRLAQRQTRMGAPPEAGGRLPRALRELA
jgi:hypothetical protein